MLPSATPQRHLTPLQDLACGAVAGMTARMIVAPLDVVKIRFQVQSETFGRYRYSSVPTAIRSILATEGLSALWKGNVPALVMVTPYAALQLTTFYQLKRAFPLPLPEPCASLTFGALSASFATVCTYPLDLLRTRFAAQPEPKQYTSISHALTSIVRQHGVVGLYAGLRPTLVEIVPYMALHFAIYERTKALTLENLHLQYLHPIHSASLGAFAGTTSKLLTLPLDNAKKVMQVQPQFNPHASRAPQYRGIGDVLYSLWSRGGILAWYRGAVPSLLKAAPNSAITFLVYESTKKHLTD